MTTSALGAHGRTCRSVLVELANEVGRTARHRRLGSEPEAHLGADLAYSSDPHAVRLRSAGASFEWLAFAHSGTPMWTAHVGVVRVADASYDIGLHLTDRLSTAEARLRRLADPLGLTPTYSAASAEHQLVVGRLSLPGQQDEAVRLCLDLFQQLSRSAG